MIKLICKNCSKEFYRYPFVLKSNRGKFCSKKCSYAGMDKENMGKNPNSLKNLKKMSSKRAKELGFGKWMKDKKISKETRLKISSSLKGGNSKSFKKGQHISPFTQFKKGHITWNKGKGTKCKEAELIRSSIEYKEWRREVFKRDRWTCVWCGYKGSKLNADHIKPFAYYPELRLDLNNGRTLCIDCHKKTDTYMRRQYAS